MACVTVAGGTHDHKYGLADNVTEKKSCNAFPLHPAMFQGHAYDELNTNESNIQERMSLQQLTAQTNILL